LLRPVPHIPLSTRPRFAVAVLSIVAALICGVTGAARAGGPATAAPPAPIVVLTNGADPFSTYYGEILRAEGLNEFDSIDLADVSAATLVGRAVVLLPPSPVTPDQSDLLAAFVGAGGNLIAFRPDKALGELLGLGDTTGTLSDAYYKIDTSQPPGKGITGETMQFHGTADRWTLAGATSVANLYQTAVVGSGDPAVTVRSVGTAGGQAAAFSFDVARSIVYTRQGNPRWAGQERDFGIDTDTRSDDLFFGAKPGDVQPDWVDLSKVRVPQADELQRLLANLITDMSARHIPLPRFWYLPRGYKAAVVMTGDDHDKGGTAGQFDRLVAESPSDCSVAQWTCLRGTSYMFPDTPLTDAQVAAYQAQGFELGLHLDTGCANFTPDSLRAEWRDQIARAAVKWPSMAPLSSSRTHCVTWSDWASQPIIEAEHGVRLDTNYYYWPGSWVKDRPGMFTGSGFPMRFADLDGSTIDVYQATTQLTDESEINIPVHIRALLDGALGSDGYYGVFTANMHTDVNDHPGADAIVAEAQSRGVPVIAARQLLEWLDIRDGSSFTGLSYAGNDLKFSIVTQDQDSGLDAMLPSTGPGGALKELRRDGVDVATTARTVKGIDYAVFPGTSGEYVATYGDALPEPTPQATPADTPSISAGPAPAAQLPVATPTPRPVLSRLRVTGVLKGRHGRLRVTFSLSSAAKVRFRVVRRGARKPSATWTARGRAGSNAFTLKRKLPNRKTLGRGTYTIAVGFSAPVASARFRVR
jgi:hypothetical protein